MFLFLNSVATLMSNQLKSLTLETLKKYVDLLNRYADGNDYRPPYSYDFNCYPQFLTIFMVRVTFPLDNKV